MAYQHGAYGQIMDTKIASAQQGSTVVVYVGTAPVGLVRGYADAGLVNRPIKLANMQDVQARVGYSGDWDSYTLCEAFSAHFNSKLGNVGPIYIINALDPDTHRKTEATTASVTFANGRGEILSSTIILDTLAIADKAEGVDYTLTYDASKGVAVITSLKEDAPLSGSISVTYSEMDPTKITAAEIIGGVSELGVYTGLGAVALLYQTANAVVNVIAAPGWSSDPDVYKAMVAASQKINGHWDAFVNADIPVQDGETAIDTRAKAITWKEANGYNSEFSKVYWPMVKKGSQVYHLSTLGTVTMQRTDNTHNGIPFESPSNKVIDVDDQYFGADSPNMGFDQHAGNELNAKGITTAAFWGGNWVLWGPHTAGFEYGADGDARAIFDINVRLLEHITNGFQLRNGTEIDQPMTASKKDEVLRREQEELDTLVAIGALTGTPIVEFVESENPIGNLMNGDFVWDISATPTPPYKSGTARVTYTTDGFAALLGGEQ